MTSFGDLRDAIATVHDPTRPQEQRQQAEGMLSRFKQQPDSLRQSMSALESLVPMLRMAAGGSVPGGSNEAIFSAWTALDVIEYFAEFRTCSPAVSTEEVLGLRQWLFQFLLVEGIPNYLTTKAAKALAEIAKSCYPARTPDFFDALFGVFQAPTLSAREVDAALKVLGICAEELCTPQQQAGTRSVSALESRRRELRTLMLALAPKAFAALNGLIGRILAACPGFAESGLPLEQQELVADALLCVKQFFSWTPLDVVFGMKPSILYTVFTVLRADSLRGVGLECLSEVLSQVYVPSTPEARESLAAIFDQGLMLAQALGSLPVVALNAMADNEFLSKAVQFLLLLLRSLRRVPDWANARAFIQAFVQLTLRVPNVVEQLNCLEGLYSAFEDILSRLMDEEEDEEFGGLGAVGAAGRAQPGRRTARQFRDECAEMLVAAQQRFLSLALWSSNKDVLSILDEVSPTDDQGESELGMYVTECVNCVAILTEIYQAKVLVGLGEFVVSSVEKFLAAAATVCQAGGLAPSAPILEAFSDMVTLLALGSRLTDLFVESRLGERLAMSRALFARTLDLVQWANRVNLGISFASVGRSSDSAMSAHARLLGTLAFWFRWLNDLLRSSAAGEEEASQLTFRVIDNTLTPFVQYVQLQQQAQQQQAQGQGSAGVPRVCTVCCPCVARVAASAFRSLCFTVRPKCLSSHPMVQAAITSQTLLQQLSPDSRGFLVSGLVAVLALPCAGSSLAQQNWEARKALCESFLAPFVRSFVDVTAAVCQQQQQQQQQQPSAPLYPVALETIAQSIEIMQIVSKAVRDQGTSAKRVVYPAVAGAVPAAVKLCEVSKSCGNTNMLLKLINFLSIVFESFGVQVVTVVPIANTINSLISVVGASDDVLPQLMSNAHADTNVINSVCALLELLKALSHEQAAFRTLLPNVLWFVFERVFALSKAYSHPHDLILRGVVRLVLSLLSCHFRTLAQPQWLPSAIAVLQAGLEGRDSQAFHDVAAGLEKLAAELFRTEEFQRTALLPFANILARSVVTKTHEIWRDEAITALYNLASVQWDSFFSSFLPSFIAQLENVTDDQRRTLLAQFSRQTDVPTFTNNMCTLMNDWNYYLKANAANTTLTCPTITPGLL